MWNFIRNRTQKQSSRDNAGRGYEQILGQLDRCLLYMQPKHFYDARHPYIIPT